ncbi:hypothetical protein HOW07_09500 [Plantibacter sp. MCCC 1A11337]|nr:hypothetical protein [Plantibacter sp. MCCC 1A11337]
MEEVTTYTVTAERTAKWWVLQAVDVPGAITQVARLDQADQIKEAIAFVAGVPEEEVEIDVQPVLPEEASEHLERARELRTVADWVAQEATIETRIAARRLSSGGISMRDIGMIMGVSHQRAHQVLHEPVPDEHQHRDGLIADLTVCSADRHSSTHTVEVRILRVEDGTREPSGAELANGVRTARPV